MGDKEMLSIPDENGDGERDDRKNRMQEAFGSLRRTTGEPLSDAEKEKLRSLHQAIAAGDQKTAKEHLASVREESSWLYEELMKHPEISAILRELSIMGF